MIGEVLSDKQIKKLIEGGAIIGADPRLVNPSSLDLRLGRTKWKLVGSSPPLATQSIEELLQVPNIVDESDDKTETFYLETMQPMLFRLVEQLNLPQSISARIFNKSGRGRIGISTKGLCDGMPRFNEIPKGYSGNLYAEIAPTVFPTVVKCGETAIPQIRFYDGDPQPLRGFDLELLLKKEPILFDKNGKPIEFSKEDIERICRTGKLTFTADLSRGLLAYRANRDKRTLDLTRKNFYKPEYFFEEIRAVKGEHGVNIPPGDFVLVHSNERIRLPLEYAVEIAEYTPELGDIKTHYAALVNAGHGYSPELPNGGTGDHIVFEARARDLPVYWQHGKIIAEFEIYRMSEKPETPYKSKQSTGFDSLPSILPAIFKKD